jgi:hypothetical protein
MEMGFASSARGGGRSAGILHPLVVIADQKWRTGGSPARLLTLEALTEWLAGRVGLDYLHIDPLKIDFTGVAEVMSSAYAGRFGILPVRVTTREIVIATAQPFVREWVPELQHILRKEIRRVMANPDDISRYLVEFFNLAKSVKKAAAKGEVTAGCRASSNWSSWAKATASSTPTTSTSSISSTGCGSTPSTSAPRTSTSSRGATSASSASASTACCIRCTRSRWR